MKMTKQTMKINEIIEAKNSAGDNAYLWMQASAGDCILWESEEASQDDDGYNAVGRWTLDAEQVEELEQTGEIDEQN